MPVLFKQGSGPDTEHPLFGVAGWLALFLGIIGLQDVLFLIALPSRVEALVSTGLPAFIKFPLLGPALLLEAAFPVAFLVAAPIATWLTFKRDPRTPGLWGWFIAAVCAYGVVDATLVELVLGEMAPALSASALKALKDQTLPAVIADLRTVAWAGIWTLYWKDSERVRVTFGRNAWGKRSAEPTTAMTGAAEP